MVRIGVSEVWRGLGSVNCWYLISNLGRVYSLRTNCYLKAKLRNGRRFVNLSIKDTKKGFKRRAKAVDILVLETYCPNKDGRLAYIRHLDGDLTNDQLSNLVWVNDHFLTLSNLRGKVVDALIAGKPKYLFSTGIEELADLLIDLDISSLTRDLYRGYEFTEAKIRALKYLELMGALKDGVAEHQMQAILDAYRADQNKSKLGKIDDTLAFGGLFYESKAHDRYSVSKRKYLEDLLNGVGICVYDLISGDKLVATYGDIDLIASDLKLKPSLIKRILAGKLSHVDKLTFYPASLGEQQQAEWIKRAKTAYQHDLVKYD